MPPLIRVTRRRLVPEMTPRQRQAERLIERRRALRRRRIGLGTLAGAIVLGGLWAQVTGRFEAAAIWAAKTGETAVIAAGIKVDSVTVSGRNWADGDGLRRALAIARGQSLLHLDLRAMRRRIEALGWVRRAAVYRVFPDRLHVVLTERKPFAIWQHNGDLRVIDRRGVVLGPPEAGLFAGLPLVVGQGAPDDAAALQTMLSAEPQLANRVTAAIRVGDRRWNIRFNSGVEVQLPETGAIEAWHRLAGLDRRYALLSRDIIHVDLRLDNRTVVRQRLVPFSLPGPGQEI